MINLRIELARRLPNGDARGDIATYTQCVVLRAFDEAATVRGDAGIEDYLGKVKELQTEVSELHKRLALLTVQHGAVAVHTNRKTAELRGETRLLEKAAVEKADADERFRINKNRAAAREIELLQKLGTANANVNRLKTECARLRGREIKAHAELGEANEKLRARSEVKEAWHHAEQVVTNQRDEIKNLRADLSVLRTRDLSTQKYLTQANVKIKNLIEVRDTLQEKHRERNRDLSTQKYLTQANVKIKNLIEVRDTLQEKHRERNRHEAKQVTEAHAEVNLHRNRLGNQRREINRLHKTIRAMKRMGDERIREMKDNPPMIISSGEYRLPREVVERVGENILASMNRSLLPANVVDSKGDLYTLKALEKVAVDWTIKHGVDPDLFEAAKLAFPDGAINIAGEGPLHGPGDPLTTFALEKFYVVQNSDGAIFVKGARFFEDQHGLTESWGKNWRPIRASSIEAARLCCASMFDGRGNLLTTFTNDKLPKEGWIEAPSGSGRVHLGKPLPKGDGWSCQNHYLFLRWCRAKLRVGKALVSQSFNGHQRRALWEVIESDLYQRYGWEDADPTDGHQTYEGTVPELFKLSELRDANLARIKDYPGPAGDVCRRWGVPERALELTGELGELCNLLKKELRDGPTDHQAIEDEFADVQICLDLLAIVADVNLAESTITKFNRTSAKIGSKVTL